MMSYSEKSSSSKPTATFQDVDTFVVANFYAAENSLEKLTEGHISQAFSFVNTNKQKLVIRIGKSVDDFKKDQYAYRQLKSKTLPIPEVLIVGDFPGKLYYCISVFVEGTPSDKLSEYEMKLSLESQLESLASLFSSDVSSSIGWGPIDLKTNNGVFDT